MQLQSRQHSSCCIANLLLLLYADVGTPDDADAPKAECEKCGTLIPLALLDSHEVRNLKRFHASGTAH